MGFWSDTRQLLSATGGALSEGMELLTQGASELERAAHRLNVETTIKLLERQRTSLGESWFHASNTDKHGELLDAYAELIRDFSHDSTSQARAELAQLHVDRRALTVKKQVESIVALNKRLKTTEYSLAIDAINTRKRLIRMFEELLKTGREDEHAIFLERARVRIKELRGDISELEPARRTTEITQYASGAQKVSSQRFDGKLSGVYEHRYENGNPRWRILFSKGEIQGKVEHWRKDGCRVMDADFDEEMRSFRSYSSDSELSLDGRVHKPYMTIAVHFPELEGLRFRHRLHTKPSKLLFGLKILTMPRLLSFAWRARKPGPEVEWVKEVSAAGEQCNLVVKELLAIQKAG